MLTFAIADDLAGIVVIALVYSGHINTASQGRVSDAPPYSSSRRNRRQRGRLVVGAGRRGAMGRLAFSKVSRYCLAHAQCPVVAIPPPALVGELGHGRLARAFWRRSLTPEQVLRDHDRPAA